jgi:hypothetical protein
MARRRLEVLNDKDPVGRDHPSHSPGSKKNLFYINCQKRKTVLRCSMAEIGIMMVVTIMDNLF